LHRSLGCRISADLADPQRSCCLGKAVCTASILARAPGPALHKREACPAAAYQFQVIELKVFRDSGLHHHTGNCLLARTWFNDEKKKDCWIDETKHLLCLLQICGLRIAHQSWNNQDQSVWQYQVFTFIQGLSHISKVSVRAGEGWAVCLLAAIFKIMITHPFFLQSKRHGKLIFEIT
jgi:hypothetical protein